MAVLSKEGKLICGDVVNFLSSDEFNYPQLTRLYIEFNFRVIEVTKIDNSATPHHKFTMAYKRSFDNSEIAVAPIFDSLNELEQFIEQNVVEILRDTVFESTLVANE